MNGHHLCCLDTLDLLLAALYLLCQVPQIEVNQDTANCIHIWTLISCHQCNNFCPDTLHCDYARGAQTHFLAAPWCEKRVCMQLAQECCGVGQDAQVVKDLRHAIVREHGQGTDAWSRCAGEDRMGGRWDEGRGRNWAIRGSRRRWSRVEGCPRLGYENLRAFPQTDYRQHTRASAMCVINNGSIQATPHKSERKITYLYARRSRLRHGRKGTSR